MGLLPLHQYQKRNPEFVSSHPSASIAVLPIDAKPQFKQLARDVSMALAQRGLRIVYGGGWHVGLMGIAADHGTERVVPEVIGIIPEHIRAQEVQHDRIDRTFMSFPICIPVSA